MSEKYKHLEGVVNVNGDITPTTRQPIDQIDSSRWEEMSYGELADQYEMLQTRIARAQTIGYGQMAKQMERGIAHLQSLIAEKQSTESSNLR